MEDQNNDPYYEQVTQMPAYRRFHPKVPGMLAEATLDPNEEIISAVGAAHGQGHGGQLIITNKRIRWAERFPFKKHDHWPLGTTMEMHRSFPQPIILLGGELLFQGSLNPRPFKEFVSLHQVMVESMRWEAEHAPAEPVPVVLANVSIGDELIKLEQLLNSGRLSEGEFETAKVKLLGA